MADEPIERVEIVECSLCGERLRARRSLSRHGGWVIAQHRKLGETVMCQGHVRTDHIDQAELRFREWREQGGVPLAPTSGEVDRG